MSPGLILLVILACLVAMLPVWRLRLARWPARWLFAAWLSYALGIILAVRFAGAFRFLLPILVLAYVAPFVAGPERLARVLRGRPKDGPAIIDVTPKPAPGLPEPSNDDRADESPDQGPEDGTGDGAGGSQGDTPGDPR
jgi:hypothetical protein